MTSSSEKELFAFWKKYVDGKRLYRIVPSTYLTDIKRNGLEPNKNPFKRNEKDLVAFFGILVTLHKKGFVMMRWWGGPVDQKKVVEVTLKDLRSKYIDFTPDFRPPSIIKYYLNLRGGALAQTVYIYSEELLMKRPALTARERSLVNKMNAWSKKLCQDKNQVLSIRASSPYLAHALFQYFTGPCADSPFGNFEQFKRAVKKKGLAFYRPYLIGKKLFYLRTTKAIPASELRFEP